MSVFECPCGMVVSTPDAQPRCIRCGSVLGEVHRFSVPVSAEATADVRDIGGMTASARTAHPPHHDQDALLATYASLVVIAAARAACLRGDHG